MMFLFWVSKIGIFISRVRPTRPYEVKLEPCSVIVPPKATLEEELCNETSPRLSDDCDPNKWPKANVISRSPPHKRPTMTSILTKR